MEAEMLDRDERDKLREIERQINGADPELAACLRHGQRRLPRASTRTRLLRVMIALLVLLTAVLLVLGLPAGALAVAAVAAVLWWLRRTQRHPSGGLML
jgi:Flp pilus assembly protein TadB